MIHNSMPNYINGETPLHVAATPKPQNPKTPKPLKLVEEFEYLVNSLFRLYK